MTDFDGPSQGRPQFLGRPTTACAITTVGSGDVPILTKGQVIGRSVDDQSIMSTPLADQRPEAALVGRDHCVATADQGDPLVPETLDPGTMQVEGGGEGPPRDGRPPQGRRLGIAAAIAVAGAIAAPGPTTSIVDGK